MQPDISPQWQKAIELYNRGATLEDIAKAMGVPRETARVRLKRYGVERHVSGPPLQFRATPPESNIPSEEITPVEVAMSSTRATKRAALVDVVELERDRAKRTIVGDRICSLVRSGNFLETAAAIVGINRRTIYRWLTQGRRGNPEYVQFVADYEQAQADAEARHVQNIETIAEQSLDRRVALKASEYMLGAHAPERWSPVMTQDARKVLDVVLQIIEAHASPDVYARCLDDISRLGSRPAEQVGAGTEQRLYEVGAGSSPVLAGVLGPATDEAPSGDHKGDDRP